MSVAALVVVVAGLQAAQTLLLPVLVAVFLSILAAPPVLWLERRRFPTWLAVLAVVLVVLVVLVGFGALLMGSAGDFQQALPRYRERLRDFFEAGRELLVRFDIEVSRERLAAALDPTTLMDLVGAALSKLVAAISNTGLVLLTMVFLLLEAAGFPRKLRAAMSDPTASLDRLSGVAVEVQRYLAIKTGVSLATGLLVGLFLWVLGVDFPLLWGLVAFLLNYIPSVGSILAAVPAVIIALIQLGIGYAVGVLVGYVAINTVLGNIVEPQLMGRKLGLSPLVIFISLVFWGWVWGPVGMLLSVPLTMVVKIMLEQSNDFRWIAVLLDAAPTLDKQAARGQDP